MLKQSGIAATPKNTTASQASAAASDRRLLRAVARGDETAFAQLYQRYRTPLYIYLLRLIHEPVAAEDLLQTVFVAAWRGAGRFQGRSKVATWLYRIAHHRAVSWLRSCRKVVALEQVPEIPTDDTPPQQVMQAWRAEQVRRALDQLSPEHRAVLELTFYHGFSYREIAQIVDCPVGTVKSRMSYARCRVEEHLRALGVRG